MQMEETHNREKQTLAAKDAPSNDLLNIVAHGSSVFAPIIHNVQGTSGITLTQSGVNTSEAEANNTASVITDYKESILSTYAYTREYTSCPGEHVLLADRYVDPLIIQRTRVKKQREKEMRAKGNKFFNLNTYDANQSIGIDNLFREEDGPAKKCPKAVILQGNSGNGKSFIAQKIILDWAKGDLFAGIFDVVFHLRCSELNGISGDIRLVELLNCSEEMNQILKDKDKRILFLVDGFDELRCSLPKKALPVRVDIQAKPEAILSSLLMGIMLRESFLLVTTRSTSTEKLSKLLKCPHSFREIMGFSKEGVQEYFQKFFEDKELSTQVHEQVKIHDVLYTACFSPVMCWLICNVFKQKSDMGARITSRLTSSTSIFIDFVFILLEHHCQDLNQSQKFILLKNLSQLAEDGMQKGKILFERHFVPELVLNLVGLPFLCTFQHKEGTHIKEMFSFMHLCFQEFFAALFYILLDKTEYETKIKQLLSSVSKGFHNSHLLPVIRFLFGFCNKNVINLINEKHQNTVSQDISSRLKKWIQTFVRQRTSTAFSSFIIHCLYEVNDWNFVSNIMNIWETNEAGVEIILPSSSQMAEHHAAAYCLQFCKCIQSLDLHASTVHNLKILEGTLSKCSKLNLTVNFMKDEDVDDLISLMEKDRTLQCLRIKDGSLSDHSVQLIMSTLLKQSLVAEVHLTVETINHNNIENAMNICKCLKDVKQFSLKAAASVYKEKSLCSNFNIGSGSGSLYEITIDYHDVDSSVKSGLAFVKISVGFTSIISHSGIKHIFWILNNLKEIGCPQFEKHVDALLCLLCSLPELNQVKLNAKNLSIKSTAKILSFFQDRPGNTVLRKNKEDFCFFARCDVERLQYINYENLCSLSLFTENNVFLGPKFLHLDLKVHDLSLQDKNIPILWKLSLCFPFMKGATVNWDDLLNTSSQLMKSNQRTNFSLDKQIDRLLSLLQSVPSLTKLFIHLESLPDNWILGVIYFLQTCSSLQVFQLKMGSEGKTLGLIGGEAFWRPQNFTLCFGCSHLQYHGCIILPARHSPGHNVLPCIELTMRNHAIFYSDSWPKFFHHYNQLIVMTKLCPEYDQSLHVLLSHLITIPDLKEVNMALQFLTVHGATSILHLIQTSTNLRVINALLMKKKMGVFHEQENASTDWKSFQSEGSSEEDSICSDFSDSKLSPVSDTDVKECWDIACLPEHPRLDNEMENYELDLCSELRVRKNRRNEYRLTLRCNGYNPKTKAIFSSISLTLSKIPEKSEINWRSLFQYYYETKGLNERNSIYFGKKVAALLCVLHNVPGLEKVEFGTHSLTESWAPRILMLSHASPNTHIIRLLLEQNLQNDDSACSSLTIKRNLRDFTVTVKIAMKHNTIPSDIHLKLPCSEICNLDGAGLLYRLKCLNNLSLEYDMQLNELISFIHFVPHLQKLKLCIENLTTAWAERILSLKTCRSLTKILVTTSRDILVEEAISILKYKWTCHGCVVVIRGWRCSNPTARCSHRSFYQECNKEVNLSFCGCHCSEVPLHESDSEKEENTFNRFDAEDDDVL